MSVSNILLQFSTVLKQCAEGLVSAEVYAGEVVDQIKELPPPVLVAISVVFAAIGIYNWKNRYVFDPDVIHDICAKIAVKDKLSIHEKTEALREGLQKAYPNVTINRRDDWFLNYAGGVMGAVNVLYASTWEYIIVFGSSIGSGGATGRHPLVSFYDTVLDGECSYFMEKDPFVREDYKLGERCILHAGESGASNIPNSCWLMEYARGFIPSTLPFGLVGMFCTSLDFFTFSKTMWIYTKANIRNVFPYI